MLACTISHHLPIMIFLISCPEKKIKETWDILNNISRLGGKKKGSLEGERFKKQRGLNFS